MIRATRWAASAAVACAVLLVAGCGSEDDGGAITAPDGDAQTAATAAPDTTGTTPTTAAPPTGADEGAGTEDGEHVVFLTGLDVEGRTITFDVVQFLTGQEAIDAYHEDFPDDPERPPNDYYIVNDNPQLRTAAVAEEVDVQLVRLMEDGDAEVSPGTFEELPTYLAAYADAENGRLSSFPFRLTVEGGEVTGIGELYVP